jgi:hypothetical protein
LEFRKHAQKMIAWIKYKSSKTYYNNDNSAFWFITLLKEMNLKNITMNQNGEIHLKKYKKVVNVKKMEQY